MSDEQGTSAPPALDEAALDRYLSRNVPGYRGPLTIARCGGGQSNPTYRLVTPGRSYILRRRPPGNLLPSAHAVDREYRVISALQDSAVPVPRTYCLCMDDSVIGSAFYVMSCVEGRVLWDPRLPDFSAANRGAVFDEMNRVLAALHGVDIAAVGLGDYGRHENYFERQIARWTKQYRAAQTQPVAAMEHLIDWLPRHIPPGDEVSLVHGDYRLDNLIFDGEAIRVAAVLDWELSTLGHPLADLAYHCMVWHLPPGTMRGLSGVDIAALGIPAEADYVARYCERSGRAPIAPADWDFYMSFNLFRFAAILQGICHRGLSGSASGSLEQARAMGEAVQPLAEMAWARVSGAG